MVNNNPTKLTKKQEEVLIGTLLGDGSLSIRKQCVSPRMTIRRQLRDIEYLKWQKEIFHNMCREKAVTTGKTFDKRYNKTYEYCNLETRYIPALKEVYNKWYPNKIKNVPRDIKLTPLTAAVWFCDDAYVKINYTNRIHIKFFTNSFSYDDVIFLKSLLDDITKCEFKIQQLHHKCEQYIIVGYDNESRAFLQYIDKFIPDGMKRKSDVWRNPNVCFYKNQPKPSSKKNHIEKKTKFIEHVKSSPFTIKEACTNLGYFYKKNGYNCIWIDSTIKLFIKKLIKNNLVTIIDNSNFSINSKLITTNYKLCKTFIKSNLKG